MVRYGVKVLPLMSESTKGTAGPIWSADVCTVFVCDAWRSGPVCSGMGSTKAKHASAMMVATVAQALTKDLLTRSTSHCKAGARRSQSSAGILGARCHASAHDQAGLR